MMQQAFDHSVDTMRAVLWQYDSAPKLMSLMQAKADWWGRNQMSFWEDWRRDVFDLRTANDFGLSVWAIILNLPLSAARDGEAKPTFGFGEYNQNFAHGNFFGMSTGDLPLLTGQRRQLLQLRYVQLTHRPSVPVINRALRRIYADSLVFVRDNLNMSMTYVFDYDLPSNYVLALTTLDVLPRPAGVSINIVTEP